ncbi:expressed unknown protein [Seminavis robusta]|uniref:Uncharacterized protein n=1 Tax=Seminavis robusta TaxID=568900 RepID=A0A9N8EUE0_9STRA|nr:expressed unknown protein [Seminavis robusta]|eukprot:Sro2209_g319150.1 n/a (245) ;mRNA; f:2590-3418
MEIIRMNNFAASMLCNGRNEDAIRYLQNALAGLRGVVNHVGTNETRSHPPCSSCQHGCHGCHREEPQAPLNITAVQNEELTEDGTVQNAFEFYDKVFLISNTQTHCCCPAQLEKLQHMLLAVITYNLGTVSQRMGIQYGKSWHFAKAMRFYELSFSTIENVLQEYGFDGNLIMLLCSLYNNMGHIHARSNDIEDTKFCLEWLQRTVNAEEFSNCNAMCDDDYCFFSQYLMFSSTHNHFRSAPAA